MLLYSKGATTPSTHDTTWDSRLSLDSHQSWALPAEAGQRADTLPSLRCPPTCWGVCVPGGSSGIQNKKDLEPHCSARAGPGAQVMQLLRLREPEDRALTPSLDHTRRIHSTHGAGKHKSQSFQVTKLVDILTVRSNIFKRYGQQDSNLHANHPSLT